jgi:cytochrome P450
MKQLAIPYLQGMPVLGHLLDFRNDRLNLLLRISRQLGDIGGVKLGSTSLVLMSSAEYVGSVMVDHASSVERSRRLRKLQSPFIGKGLLTSDNESHKLQRKLVAPAFHHSRIATYGQVMGDVAERIQSDWTHGATIDLSHEMMRLALAIIGRALLDADLLNEAKEVGEAFSTANRCFIESSTALMQPPIDWPTPRNRRYLRAISRLDTLVHRLIEDRRRSAEHRNDLLSMLLTAQNEDYPSGLSITEVRDHVMTFLLAGHETTAATLTWTWYLLLQHPDIYARMQAEVDSILAGRTPTIADMPQLPYVKQVLKESLRLYPPAYLIIRRVIHPITLDRYTLTPTMNVGISPYVLHRRPNYFPDPERFDPDRFMTEDQGKRPRYAYLPFGAGPHTCIGQHFAMMEAQLTLATLAQRVTFELVPGQHVEPEPLVTLQPNGPVKVVVRRRSPTKV